MYFFWERPENQPYVEGITYWSWYHSHRFECCTYMSSMMDDGDEAKEETPGGLWVIYPGSVLCGEIMYKILNVPCIYFWCTLYHIEMYQNRNLQEYLIKTAEKQGNKLIWVATPYPCVWMFFPWLSIGVWPRVWRWNCTLDDKNNFYFIVDIVIFVIQSCFIIWMLLRQTMQWDEF